MDSSARLPPFDALDVLIPMLPAQSVPAAIRRFPSTRYYGSKRKLLAWMHSKLEGLEFNHALDAFGGTGSVSLLFKAMGKSVTYHDGLRFNEDIGRTILADQPALAKHQIEKILASVRPRRGVVCDNFSGIFFKKNENAWLDGFAKSIQTKSSTPGERSLLRYLIYQACLKKRPFNLFHRANLALRTKRGVKRTFGNAVTWNRTFINHAMQAFEEIETANIKANGSVTILPSGEVEKIGTNYDLVYIDPPYVSRETRYNRDNYWRRYNFLEGFARYEEWHDLIDADSDIRLFAAPKWFMEWSQAESFKDRLFALVDRHRHSTLVLSYVSGAIPSETAIARHLRTRFAKVSVHAASHNHALSSQPKRELLFIGHPRS